MNGLPVSTRVDIEDGRRRCRDTSPPDPTRIIAGEVVIREIHTVERRSQPLPQIERASCRSYIISSFGEGMSYALSHIIYTVLYSG